MMLPSADSDEEKIKGLEQILSQFSQTFPTASNTAEWETIRGSIVASHDEPETVQFKTFVNTLADIRPRRDNVAEWQAIRQTCEEIKEGWGVTDIHLLFKKLLGRFLATVPHRDNRQEWAAIRSLSNKILDETASAPALRNPSETDADADDVNAARKNEILDQVALSKSRKSKRRRAGSRK